MERQTLRLTLLEGEYWWGGNVGDGLQMPYGSAPFQADLFHDLSYNQGCPLLISNKGRYIWSEKPFLFQFDDHELIVIGRNSSLEHGDNKGNLKETYQYVSKRYFPTTKTYPDSKLFTSPQYNLWIELLYEPTQQKVLNYADTLIKQGMPPGVLMIDDNWHEPYGTWDFHSGRFPSPKAMTDKLHDMGFQVMLWVCPFVSPDSLTFRELENQDLLLKDASGQTAIRKWWNGNSAVLDLTNPAAVNWFKHQLDHLQSAYGIDGFKFDAGDITFYEDSDQSFVPASKHDHCEAWGKIGLDYPLNEYRACWKLAGQPLVQRLKDKNHDWNENGLASLIPHTLAQGLLGYSYSCPDMIGGGEYIHFTYHSDSLDQELFVRYAQCSALFPMMQFSAAPWRVLDEMHAELCKQAAKLHLDYSDELMHWVQHAAITGEPIVRHMAYEYPEGGFEKLNDQFMIGDRLLVAPVLQKEATMRTIQFPVGTWLGDDGSSVIGPCTHNVEAPLNRLPHYRKQ